MKTTKYSVIETKNKKVPGKFKKETPNYNWIDDFICSRSKAFSFKCEDDIKNKLKGISQPQTKHIKIEEYKKRLDGEEYQGECNNYNLKSFEHEMYLQKKENHK